MNPFAPGLFADRVILMARFLRTKEVAWHGAWLLSPACEGVKGTNVLLDFGLTAGY